MGRLTLFEPQKKRKNANGQEKCSGIKIGRAFFCGQRLPACELVGLIATLRQHYTALTTALHSPYYKLLEVSYFFDFLLLLDIYIYIYYIYRYR